MVSREADRTQVRFLILTSIFLAFNISWISLSATLSFTTWKEIPTIGFLGIIMVGYTCFYILKEVDFIMPKRKAFQLSIYLTSIYAIQQVAKVKLPTNYFEYLVLVLVILLQALALIHGVKLLRPFVKSRIAGKLLSPINVATVIIACIYSFSPLLFTLVNEASIEFILINIPFVIISIAYVSHHVMQSKSESKFLIISNSNNTLNERFEMMGNETEESIAEFSELNRNERNEKIAELLAEYNLTERELQIAILIINGVSSKNIAEELSLSYNTVRWHIKHLTDKVGVRGIIEFREKYQKTSLLLK